LDRIAATLAVPLTEFFVDQESGAPPSEGLPRGRKPKSR
jgi:hypothetical protein